MSKRQEARAKQQKSQLRNRAIVIGLVVMGGLLTILFIVAQNRPVDQANIKHITPVQHKAQVGKTSLGNPEAPVRMDIWEDFQCPACLSFTQNLEPQIVEKYVETGKVYYNFRFYPFIDRGKGESQDAASAALCASAQNRFWDYHGMLFANWVGENAGSFTKGRLVAFAQAISLDMTAFNQCIEQNTHAAQIQQDIEEGTKLGVPPTPGIFVNGKMVVSSAGENYIPSFDDISRAIDAALSEK
jgi:protein-disulfide isomerase